MIPVIVRMCYKCSQVRLPKWWSEEYDTLSCEVLEPGHLGLCEICLDVSATRRMAYEVKEWDEEISVLADDHGLRDWAGLAGVCPGHPVQGVQVVSG